MCFSFAGFDVCNAFDCVDGLRIFVASIAYLLVFMVLRHLTVLIPLVNFMRRMGAFCALNCWYLSCFRTLFSVFEWFDAFAGDTWV